MAKRIFTDESLETFVDETKSYVESQVGILADKVIYFEYDEAATAALIDLLPQAEEVEF